MHSVFSKPFTIHFSDCDSTGLVFHPHFFRWAVDTEEAFFREILGEKIFGPGVTDQIYAPMAGIQAEFSAPLRAGDKVEFRLWIEQLGWSSIRWAFEIMKDDSPRSKSLKLWCSLSFSLMAHLKRWKLLKTIEEKWLPMSKMTMNRGSGSGLRIKKFDI